MTAFQILSLDGGGLRGLFSAAILEQLEDDLGTQIVSHFDLIAGTSTGGLIALGLASGMRPRDMVDFYVKVGPAIFRHPALRSIRHAIRAKYDSRELSSSLQSVFGEKTLADCKHRLIVPAFSLETNEVYIFKTPHHERLRRDYRERLVDVALATTAAPTYFNIARLRRIRLVDGGVWATNPVLIAVTEAVSMLQIPLADIHVLSLGTTTSVTRYGRSLNRGGVAQWAKTLPDLFVRAQSLGSLHSAEHLIGPDHVRRIDAAVPKRLFKLDRLDSAAIRGLAEDVSRRHSPLVEPLTRHVAPEYNPLYS